MGKAPLAQSIEHRISVPNGNRHVSIIYLSAFVVRSTIPYDQRVEVSLRIGGHRAQGPLQFAKSGGAGAQVPEDARLPLARDQPDRLQRHSRSSVDRHATYLFVTTCRASGNATLWNRRTRPWQPRRFTTGSAASMRSSASPRDSMSASGSIRSLPPSARMDRDPACCAVPRRSARRSAALFGAPRRPPRNGAPSPGQAPHRSFMASTGALPRLMTALRILYSVALSSSYLEWGSRLAVINSADGPPSRKPRQCRNGAGAKPAGPISLAARRPLSRPLLAHDRQRPALIVVEEGHPLLGAVRVAMDHVRRADELAPRSSISACAAAMSATRK